MGIAPVVIIGGGTAGSIVARTLASLTTHGIVVLEPGALTDDDNPRFLDGLKDDCLWPGEPMPQARAIGGGSAVNGMILSGSAPQWLGDLTRHARPEETGSIGRALLDHGGRLSRMWWNNGRWNPGRSMMHVVDEGGIEVRREAAVSLEVVAGTARAVMTGTGPVECSHVVMCAGALLTPRILVASGLAGGIGRGLQNHPTVTFAVRRTDDDHGFFDACVVMDLRIEGAVGLMVAYERESAVSTGVGAVSVSLMNPVSRGHAGRAVDFALLKEPVDRTRMDHLVAETRRILARAGLEVTAESRVHPVSHATSSCASVTDSTGLLHGHGNISIADASVLPGVPEETPAASVTIGALRIARGLGGRLA